MITSSDRAILRELAHRQLEVANSPKNRERTELWYRHNDLAGERPIVHIETDTFEQEVIPPLLRCEDPLARRMERDLYHSVVNLELFDDDRVAPDYFPVQLETYFHPFGFVIEKAYSAGENQVGHRFVHPIVDLEADWEKLGDSQYGVDMQGAQQYAETARECFGDILPTRITMQCLYAVPTQMVVHLMGMEQMCLAFFDCPELFHEMMDRLANDYIAFFRQMWERGQLCPTNSFEWLGNGSFCFTRQLPDAPKSTKEMWGFLDSQETVSISPSMYNEFIYPYYKRIAGEYGLLSYGCCEPVDPVWDDVSRLPGLRKVSISPWCNQQVMGERLRGADIIFHRKPSPNFLGIGGALDEGAVRAHIRETLEAAKGCKLEISQRDVYTIGSDLGKVKRYIAIIREEIDRSWQA